MANCSWPDHLLPELWAVIMENLDFADRRAPRIVSKLFYDSLSRLSDPSRLTFMHEVQYDSGSKIVHVRIVVPFLCITWEETRRRRTIVFDVRSGDYLVSSPPDPSDHDFDPNEEYEEEFNVECAIRHISTSKKKRILIDSQADWGGRSQHPRGPMFDSLLNISGGMTFKGNCIQVRFISPADTAGVVVKYRRLIPIWAKSGIVLPINPSIFDAFRSFSV